MRIYVFVFSFYCALQYSTFGLQFNIGVVHSAQSMVWQNVRHAADEWNMAQTIEPFKRPRISFTLKLNVIAPSDSFAGADTRFCDVAQREIVAFIVPSREATLTSSFLASKSESKQQASSSLTLNELSNDDILLVLSMCERFKLPCITDAHVPSFANSEFVLNVGVGADVVGKALAQLISHLMWNQFLIAYRTPEDLAEVADILSVWHTVNGARTAIKMLRLPPETIYYDAFLKHIREKLRITNIVVHTNELSTIHTLLLRANRLNMTQSRYSYIFTHPDLRLLEDFFTGFSNTFHCNISGIQLRRLSYGDIRAHTTQTQPLQKTDLSLAFDAVNLVGDALSGLSARRLAPESQVLLCDANDAWRDGAFFAGTLRDQKFGHLRGSTRRLTIKPASDSVESESEDEAEEEEGEDFDGTLPTQHYHHHLDYGLLRQKSVGSLSSAENIVNTRAHLSATISAITRTVNEKFVEVGVWNGASSAWHFDERYEDKWKFRSGGGSSGSRSGKRHDVSSNLSGEKLRVVVYLEEPFVTRKADYESSGTPDDVDEAEKLARGARFEADVFEEATEEEVKLRRNSKQDGGSARLDAAERARRKQRRCARTLAYEGFCIDLLCEMAVILNFTFEIAEVEDGSYGVEDEYGVWNGIIGVLQRHEADLSVSAVTITYSRASVIDFTLPFMHLGIAILIARNNDDGTLLRQQKSGNSALFTFLEPLSFSVWLALGVAYFFVGCALCFLACVSPYEWFNDAQRPDPAEKDAAKLKKARKHKNQFDLLNSLWFAVGSLMHQGSDVIPRAAATRALALVWWMFTLILISTYTAQLAAFLTVERMSTSIESAADLASQQRIKFGTLRNGSTMDFFRESKIPIYERMWSIMQSTSPPVFVNSSKEGIARVKAGDYAYLMESSMLEFYTGDDCQLQTVGGLLDSKGYGVALPKGSSLRNLFSKAILQLQERTILEALKNKWWKAGRRRRKAEAKVPSSDASVSSGSGGGCALSETLGGKSSRSSLDSVFGIFYVLYAGIVLAVLIAVGEFCVESRGPSLRMGLTLTGRLTGWLSAFRFTRREPTDANFTLGHDQKTYLESAECRQLYGSTISSCTSYSTKTRQSARANDKSNSTAAQSAAVYFQSGQDDDCQHITLVPRRRKEREREHFAFETENLPACGVQPKEDDSKKQQPTAASPPHSTSKMIASDIVRNLQQLSKEQQTASMSSSCAGRGRKRSSIFARLSTPTVSFSIDPVDIYGAATDDYGDDDTPESRARESIHRLIPQTDELLLTRRISVSAAPSLHLSQINGNSTAKNYSRSRV